MPPVSALREVWFFDVGTAETRIQYSGQTFHQATQCLYSPSQKEVVALSSKLPTGSQNIEVSDTVLSEPLIKGRFSDFDQGVSYLRLWRQQLKPQTWWREWVPSSQQVKVAVPSQAFPSDRQVLARMYRLAGWSEVKLLNKSHLHWQHFRTQLAEGMMGLVIDIGAATTEIVCFDQQRVLGVITWYQGSQDLTRRIQYQAQRQLSAQLTWMQAEQVKHNLAGVWPAALAGRLQAKQYSVKARELHTGSTMTLPFPASILHEAYTEWYEELVKKIQSVLTLPSVSKSLKGTELRTWLAGGGGQLPGLDEALAVELHGPVVVASNPEQVVLKGLVVS